MDIDFATGFVWFASFLFSTTVHEAMHALAAWRLGDPTAYNGGQVTLSPAPHVAREPVGMLVVPMVTALTQGWAIGWASCPYDPVLGRALPATRSRDGSRRTVRELPHRRRRVRRH